MGPMKWPLESQECLFKNKIRGGKDQNYAILNLLLFIATRLAHVNASQDPTRPTPHWGERRDRL